MEFVATPDEQAAVVASAAPGAKLLTFMEHRENMVRMFKGPRALPARWARMGSQVTSLADTAQVGEFFTFQASLFPVSICLLVCFVHLFSHQQLIALKIFRCLIVCCCLLTCEAR
jgi:hypothetical protein